MIIIDTNCREREIGEYKGKTVEKEVGEKVIKIFILGL
jgi:hypothetical protein